VIQAECSLVKHLGELDEGKLHVQFDVEGAGEALSFTLPRTLAYLLRGDLVAESYVPNRKNRDRRTFVRHCASLLKMRVEVKNRIHALLDKYGLSYDFTDLFSKEGLEWLHSLNLPASDDHILKSNLQILQTLNEEIRNADIQIAKDAVDMEQAKLLMTMPGVDYYSAMLLLAEIGDIKRFSSPKKLVAYAGLAPGMRSSAEKTVRGHITKEGNKHLRWILVEAAQHASRYDPKLQSFYNRVSARRGRHRAIVGVARKLLVSIYHVLNRNETYHGQRHELLERKIRNLQRIVDSSLQSKRDNQT